MGERFFQIGAGHVGGVERLHSRQAAVDSLGVHKGLLDPGAQQALAHRGLGLVQHPKQGAPLLAAAHRLGQFEVRTSHRRQAHVLGVGIVLHGLDTLDAVLLRFVQVVDHGGHSIRHQGILLVAEGIPPIGAELVRHGGFHHAVLKAGILPQFHQGVGMLLDVGSHILEVQHRRANQDLTGHVAA